MTNLLSLDVTNPAELDAALDGAGATVSGISHLVDGQTLNIVALMQALTHRERRNLCHVIDRIEERQGRPTRIKLEGRVGGFQS